MKARTLALVALGASAAGLAYTFVGYSVIMRLLGRTRKAPTPVEGAPLPHVTVVVVAHNEGNRITARIHNLLASDYPADLLQILIVSDGSTDDTVVQAQDIADHRIAILARAQRTGKAACLNAALRQVATEVVIFADARQRFAPDAIRNLASHFQDGRIGAVSGSLEIDSAQSSVGAGVDAYWRMEKVLRENEARWDSCIGCTGAIYAIRRALYEPIPEDTLLDDVVIPMQITAQGFRVLHEPQARAFDPQRLEPVAEKARKRRTLAGNFQMLVRYPQWMLPWRNRLWWQLISHKYLRLLSPVLLAKAFLANGLLIAQPLFRLTFLAQFAFYGLAAVGMLFPRWKSRALSLPSAFVFLNLGVIRAAWHFLRSRDLHRWEVGGTRGQTPSASRPSSRG